MYLKEIKTYGFKSFADKTSLLFGPYINGIVGPNGSGKSNIVDAIRFVLGEQSMKSLRGDNNMLDVIFSGSKSRKPLNSASVALVFDNSDHHLPIEYEEVSIKRVIYKTGENEYFLNNERCRLKDITDLLTDSSASKESFNIISQGQISEILSHKPTDRRIIFEEASGVLKYKKRKEEALRKLERTNENINRVNDIINELKMQIGPLKQQSISAKEYLTKKEQLKNLEIALIVDEVIKNNFSYQQLQEEITSINKEILSTNTIISNNEANILKSKSVLKSFEEDCLNKQNELYTKNSELEQLNTSFKLLKERKKYELDVNDVKLRVIQLQEEKLKLESRINNLNNKKVVDSKKTSDIVSSLVGLSNSARDKKDKIDKTLLEIQKLKNLNNDYQYKIEYLEERIDNIASYPTAIKKIIDKSIFGVHDVIGNLVKYDSKYANAVAIALLGSSYNLVVDNSLVAKECIKYLKDNNIGRATFLPIDVMKSRYVDDNTLLSIKNDAGFVNTLGELVEYDPMYKNVILSQIGNILVVNNIDSANRISKIISNRYKIITLDGQVINVGGSITGGNINIKNSTIKDKYELNNYKSCLEQNKTKLNNLTSNLDIENKELSSLNNRVFESNKELNLLKESNQIIEQDIDSLNNELKEINLEIDGLNHDDHQEESLIEQINAQNILINEMKQELAILRLEETKNKEIIEQLEQETRKYQSLINRRQKELTEKEILANRIDVKVDTLLSDLKEEYNMTFENAKENYILELDSIEAKKIVNTLKEAISKIGIVNLGAIEEYDRVSERYDFLNSQRESLDKAVGTLTDIIDEMDEVMKNKFLLTFKEINQEFQKVFKRLFQGGDAMLKLTDPNNLLETGIEIVAVPAGKSLKSISLLSGGEKTLTAITLLFAILNIKPVPFCIFDEVEAALDEANVELFGNYLNEYRNKTQFILITHKKKTMEYADILYGITMQESGVSKLVSVKLEEKE